MESILLVLMITFVVGSQHTLAPLQLMLLDHHFIMFVWSIWWGKPSAVILQMCLEVSKIHLFKLLFLAVATFHFDL
jgi:hypothetical protein